MAEALIPLAEARKAKSTEQNGVELLNAASIVPQPIDWIWRGWLAAGKLHILAGSPGTGKTTLAVEFAAIITVGGRWPDDCISETGDVLIWSGEDDAGDSLVPRLMACGADRSRVHFIGDAKQDGVRRAFDPATDMDALLSSLRHIANPRLIIVDPIVAAISGDSHKNAEVRRGLQPLVDLAGKIGCAVLGITHFTKGTQGRDPAERVTGSLAFGALARLVLCTAKPTEENSKRRLVRAKSNIGPDGGGFEYDLGRKEIHAYPGVEGQFVLWGNPISGTARALLEEVEADTSDDDKQTAIGDANAFLRDLLKDGPVAVKNVQQQAKDAGLSFATVKRAKHGLMVKSYKPDMTSGWAWQLPGNTTPSDRRCSSNPEDAQQNCVSTFGNDEHLREPTTIPDEWEDTL